MKKSYLFIYILLFFVGKANAQTIRVFDMQNLKSIAKVKATKSIQGQPKFTNNAGEVDLGQLEPNDTIWFSAPGYILISFTAAQLKTKQYKVGLTEKAYDLDEVVISASKFEEKKSDVAFQVLTIKASDLQNMNQQTTADVLQNSGQVLVQKSQGGGGSPIIRGFEASRLLMVIDGVRMNNAIYRSGHLQNIITLDNTVMDRVEVVFGPSSTVYGSDALGGVMHFHTKTPLLSDEKLKANANAFLRSSSASMEKSGHLDFNLGWKKFASLTSFTYSDFGDLRSGNNKNSAYGDWGKRLWYQDRMNGKDTMIENPDHNIQIGSGYSQYDLLQKFLYKQSNKVSHLLNFQYSTSSNIDRYDRLSQLSGGLPRFAEWYYGPQKRIFAAYNLILTKDSGFYDDARIILSYQNIEESRNDRRFNKVYLNQQFEQVDVIAINADFSKQIKKHELRYGVEGVYNKVNSIAITKDIVMDTTATYTTRYPDGGSTVNSIAAYFTHTFEIGEKFVINDGVRYSIINLQSSWIDTTFYPFPFSSFTQNNSALTGSLGIIYKPTTEWKISLAASTGFRAPNVDDLSKVFETTVGNIIVPNPEIKPEYTYNVDLGVQKTFNKRVSLDVVAYYTWYTNYISLRPGTFNGNDSIVYEGSLSAVSTSKNADNAYIAGCSANFVADVTDNFSINSSINYTYGRVKTDTTDYPLDHVAPVFGKTSMILKWKKFRGEFFAMYSGWKNLKDYNFIGEDNISIGSVNNNATNYGMPAWVTLNIRASYQVIKNLQLQLALENLTDQHYRSFASNISAPGRNFVVTLRGSF
jgi:hemoglobin/transferrin/lactoferrin receptor protein